MNFIDINAMVGKWVYKNFYIQEPDELVREMERLSIERAYIIDLKAWLGDISVGNEATLEATRGRESLTPVMVLNPLIDYEFGGKKAVIENICKNKIGAVRLFPVDHNYTLNIWNVQELFELLEEMRMPVFIDHMENSGNLDECYGQIFELCKAFPNVPVVSLTVGYRTGRILYKIWEQCPNFYIDTSLFIAYRAIEDVVKYFGSDRILFGTRMPYLEPGTFVGRVLYADISEQDKLNIARENILRLNSQIVYPI